MLAWGEDSGVQKVMDIVFRRNRPVPRIPICPSHHVEMRLRGRLGTPARFSKQSQEDYTLIYFCPVPECNETAERVVNRSQIPVPGMEPVRPEYARGGDEFSL
jgi:hypothetical protein